MGAVIAGRHPLARRCTRELLRRARTGAALRRRARERRRRYPKAVLIVGQERGRVAVERGRSLRVGQHFLLLKSIVPSMRDQHRSEMLLQLVVEHVYQGFEIGLFSDEQ